MCDRKENLRDGKRESVYSLVCQNVKHSCVNMSPLYNLDLRLFANYVNNGFEFPVTMAQVIRDGTNFEIRPQRKHSMVIKRKEAVTVLL